jgi:hypothetical protein
MTPSTGRTSGKFLFGGLAAVFAVLGLALIAFRAALGLEPGETAIISAALILTAAADLLILWRLDRLAPAGSAGRK